MGLVRGSVCNYCLGGCSALFVCARRSRQVRGVGAGAGSCVSPVPPSPPSRSPRCVWRVVPSGCRLPSPAGTPFHAVCAFRGLGPVALMVFPACPLHVCALALPRRPRPSPLPGSVWRAHLAWFRCRAPVGPLRAVRVPPRFLPRSRALSGLLGGGGGPVPFPPYLALGRVPPCGRAWVGGRGAACMPPPPRRRGRGASRGLGSLYLGPSFCFPRAGTKAGVIGVAQFMEDLVSILFRFVSAC